MKKYVKSYETIQLNVEHFNESEKVLISATNIDVVISYYWSAGDRLIPFPRNGEYEETVFAKDVKVVEHTFSEKMNGKYIGDTTEWNLIIDGKDWEVDVDDFEDTPGGLFIDAVVGWG